ncbi:MAG TPA: hypothetical protein VGJ72_15815 [Polaromonas sp.]|jgi:hypothetical protein
MASSIGSGHGLVCNDRQLGTARLADAAIHPLVVPRVAGRGAGNGLHIHRGRATDAPRSGLPCSFCLSAVVSLKPRCFEQDSVDDEN